MVRHEWNTYTLGRYSEQPDATKLKATVVQYEKDRVVTQAEKDRTLSNVDTIYDYKTGKECLLVSRAGGKSTFTEEYKGGQTDVAIITPSSGRKVCIASIITAIDADSGDILLDFATSSKKVWRHYGAKFKTQGGTDLHLDGGVDEVLTLNTTQPGGKNVFILVNYREVD